MTICNLVNCKTIQTLHFNTEDTSLESCRDETLNPYRAKFCVTVRNRTLHFLRV